MKEVLEGKLKQLTNDELMLEAIKFVFNARIEKEKPNIESTDDNVILGEKYRAYEQAKRLLTEILVDIDSYMDRSSESDTFNKGK